ncbi:hypothetical protein KEM55_003741 [Ascosphaera atra]|nr:hypothetical protein KEM55_003741 [Ascosphaera atra]
MAPFKLFSRRPTSDVPSSVDHPDSATRDGSHEPTRLPPLSVANIGRNSRDSEASAASYKLSVVNDSGVYLPPSPTEDEASFWGFPRPVYVHILSYLDIEPTPANHPTLIQDISVRSPVRSEATSRTSLDSRLPRYPCAHNVRTRFAPPEEEKFEDVGLDDDVPSTNNNKENTSGTSFVSGLTGGRLSSFMHSRSQPQQHQQSAQQSQTSLNQPESGAGTDTQSRPKRSFFSRFSTAGNSANAAAPLQDRSSESLAQQMPPPARNSSNGNATPTPAPAPIKESFTSSIMSVLTSSNSSSNASPSTTATGTSKDTNDSNNSKPAQSSTSHLPFRIGRKRAQSNASTKDAQELEDMSSSDDDAKAKEAEPQPHGVMSEATKP